MWAILAKRLLNAEKKRQTIAINKNQNEEFRDESNL